MENVFKVGDSVLLVYDRNRRWIKTISKDHFHCNYGTIQLYDLVGQPFGKSIETSKGKWLHAFPPTMIDWIRGFKHQSQIIYEKDAAMISLLLDAKPGNVIYEAGTGSGALTSILARVVGLNGKIVTHDNREQAIKIAKINSGRVGLSNIEFNLRDVKKDGFYEGKADSLVLDLGDPWEIIPQVRKILLPAGKLVIFVPTFDQLNKLIEPLDLNNFKDIRAIELLEREIQMKKDAIRPSTRMIGHTGFLVACRFKG